jgi:hypothetical protein
MDKFGAGGWIVVGIALIILGAVLRTGILQWLLDIMGWILIIMGVIAVILGGVSLITGKKSRSGGF